jgi:hypothetical protein
MGTKDHDYGCRLWKLGRHLVADGCGSAGARSGQAASLSALSVSAPGTWTPQRINHRLADQLPDPSAHALVEYLLQSERLGSKQPLTESEVVIRFGFSCREIAVRITRSDRHERTFYFFATTVLSIAS